jgi:hypothetical protein
MPRLLQRRRTPSIQSDITTRLHQLRDNIQTRNRRTTHSPSNYTSPITSTSNNHFQLYLNSSTESTLQSSSTPHLISSSVTSPSSNIQPVPNPISLTSLPIFNNNRQSLSLPPIPHVFYSYFSFINIIVSYYNLASTTPAACT